MIQGRSKFRLLASPRGQRAGVIRSIDVAGVRPRLERARTARRPLRTLPVLT